jgi:hypothetical protein
VLVSNVLLVSACQVEILLILTPSNVVRYQSFGGLHCLHFQGKVKPLNDNLLSSLSETWNFEYCVKMEEITSSKMLESFRKTTLRQNPVELELIIHRHKKTQISNW